MRKAFTLIEVLFAVMIMSLVGLALLQSSSNNTKLISHNAHKNGFVHLSSIFVLNMDETLHNSSKTLDDLLDKKYKLDDDTRQFFKEKTYLLKRDNIQEVTLRETVVTNESLDFLVTKYSMGGDFGAYMYTIESKGL